MGGIPSRYRWLAVAALATLGILVRMSCTIWARPPFLFFQGSEVEPVVGLDLGGEPRAFVQALAPAKSTPPGAIRLERAQNVFFSADGSQHVLVEIHDGKTQVELPSRSHTTLGGQYWFELESSGRVVVAVSEAPRADGQHELLVLDENGNVLTTVATPEPLWVALASQGSRIAIGTASGVRVVARDGSEVSSFPGESESGALSEQGEWLAFEQTTAAEPRLVITRVGGQQAVRGFPVSRGTALVFSPDGHQLAHVAADKLQVFTLENEVRLAFQRAPPTGNRWRDAAFDERGKLVAGRLRVDKPLHDKVEGGATRGLSGVAQVGVETLGESGEVLSAKEWLVDLWSAASPELAIAHGRVFALVWPSAFEVMP